ncbi:MAG: formaldehyde-activating enzyme, partial [Methyloprofundus sp.]
MSILTQVLSFFDKDEKIEESEVSSETVVTATSEPKLKTKEESTKMAKINKMCVGESLIGEGNEVAHIDLIIGPRGSAAETSFANCLTNNKDGFSSVLAIVAPNLMVKPSTVMFNKVTIKGSKQAV